MPTLVADQVASRLFAQDHTLWGEAAEAESAKRLAWTGLPRTSRHLVGEVAALRDELAADRLRPRRALRDGRLLARARGHLRDGRRAHRRPRLLRPRRRPRRPDRPRPHRRRRVEQVRLHRRDRQPAPGVRAGLPRRRHRPDDPASSSSPTRAARWTATARAAGFRVVNADPDVGGRYSALTAFGLVPSGLAGADIEALLDDAEAVADLLAADDDANPALRLGRRDGRHRAAARQARARRRRHRERRVRRLGRAAHRRVDRQGRHRHPARRRHRQRAGAPLRRRHRRAARRLRRATTRPRRRLVRRPRPPLVTVAGPLGAQLLLWEAATAVAGRLLGINPFDQPDVESAKAAARELLDAGIGAGEDPAFTDGAVEVRALGGDWLGDATHRRRRGRRPPRAARPLPRLRRGHGLPRPRGRRRPRARRPRPVRPHRPPGDLRLGSALPPLHRAVPQGRAGHRRLRAGDDRRPSRTSAVPGRDFTLRPVHRGPGRR